VNPTQLLDAERVMQRLAQQSSETSRSLDDREIGEDRRDTELFASAREMLVAHLAINADA